MSKISSHILSIISSYTTKEITKNQFNNLQEWLNESSENKRTFSNYLQFYKKSRRISFVVNLDKDKAWKDIVLRLEKPLNVENKKSSSKVIRLKSISRFLKYAAMTIILLGLGYLFKDNIFNDKIEPTPIIVNTNTIIPGSDKATLTLEDGSTVFLEKGADLHTENAASNGEEIIYKASKQNITEIAYNYLTIPRGGEYFVKLSDGTQVWLNSESQLKYPVNFVEGKSRQVELVYGEAYFDVSPSTEHKGAKFIVFNQSQEVEVLGTEFNIKAYEDEINIYTTLVEGKVTIGNGDIIQNLIPDHQSILDIETNEIKITAVDVNSETSWRKGVFSFKGKPLKDIMKVISRWYDVDVVFVNKNLESVKFKGNLNKNQSIERILSIMLSSKLNKYEIKNKTILLK